MIKIGMFIRCILACIAVAHAMLTFALPESPIAPPNVKLLDDFDVNLASGQLQKKISTVSIGGEQGLSHNVELYSTLWTTGTFYGFIDKFFGSAAAKQISDNSISIIMDGDDVMLFRDGGAYEYDINKRLYVMRVYGPAGNQDFVVFNDGVVRGNSSSVTGYTYKAVGDKRHLLLESPNKQYLTWITPEGIETLYERGSPGGWGAFTGGVMREITYPNGFKIRLHEKGVVTNTGWMLKYHIPSNWKTPSEVVGINLVHQYCDSSAATCSSTG